MIVIVLISILFFSLALLGLLAAIDLRERLLPNKYVFPFAALGLVFHLLTQFEILSASMIALGALTGYGSLWLIRFVANRHYGQDSLGLGDVKLMGAAGLWLGLDGVLFTLTIGAFAGVLHGIGYALWIALRDRQRPSFHKLMIPAGPGFIVGIVLVGAWLFTPYLSEWFYGFGA